MIAVSLRYEQSDHMTRVFQLTNWRRFDEAISEAEQWLREEPENANAYGMLAQIYMKSGKYDKALHWSAESLKYDPENKIGWFVRVIVLYSQGKEKEYLQAVKEAQRIDPYESHYLFLSFNLYHKKGKLQQAREELDQALRLAPDNSLYLAGDSYLHANARNFQASLASEQAALFQNPDHDQTFLYLAWAAEKRGDYDKEQEYLKNAIRLDPTDAQIRREYLKSLQKSYWFYRLLLLPSFIKKMKPWQIFLTWIVAWLLFKPLIILFIVLHVLSHWTSKLLVKAKVFGWRSIFRRQS